MHILLAPATSYPYNNHNDYPSYIGIPMSNSTGANASSTDMIVDLLGKGYNTSAIARILEITPSAVSQVATTHEAEIAEISADFRMAAVAQDNAMDDIEGILIAKLTALAALETDSNKVLNMFKTINTAKRRSRGEGAVPGMGNVTITQNTVQLHLPAHTAAKAVEYVVNPQNEVVQVEGRNIVTAGNKQVADQMQKYLATKTKDAYIDILETDTPITTPALEG
jgi:predicted transcriptional regulator